MYPSNPETTMFRHWNVASAFLSPKLMTIYSYSPDGVMKAEISHACAQNQTCQYPFNKSSLLYTSLAGTTWSIQFSMRSSGEESGFSQKPLHAVQWLQQIYMMQLSSFLAVRSCSDIILLRQLIDNRVRTHKCFTWNREPTLKKPKSERPDLQD